MFKHSFQWLEQDGTEPRVHSMEEADCLFFDRATRQYLTSGDPSSDLIKNMREALQVNIHEALRAQWRTKPLGESAALGPDSTLNW